MAIDSGDDFWSNEYRFRCADDNYMYVFDRAYIIRNADGKPIRFLGTTMDITDAMHDPLTGLYNRRYMEEMFQREVLRARRSHQPISLILIDLDNFKQVNDSLGHAAGDALLRALGNFLRLHIRGADIACRFGGDEFMLALPGASLQSAVQRAEALRRGCRDLKMERFGELPDDFSLSLGVATYPQHGQNREALFDSADRALYTAKQSGRNRVVAAPNGNGEKKNR
jgi:diguanylate cyclase (GGDEF)-like protein